MLDFYSRLFALLMRCLGTASYAMHKDIAQNQRENIIDYRHKLVDNFCSKVYYVGKGAGKKIFMIKRQDFLSFYSSQKCHSTEMMKWMREVYLNGETVTRSKKKCHSSLISWQQSLLPLCQSCVDDHREGIDGACHIQLGASGLAICESFFIS